MVCQGQLSCMPDAIHLNMKLCPTMLQALMERLGEAHVVFPAAVGSHALSGELQAALEGSGVPFVGPCSQVLPAVSDKSRCEACSFAGPASCQGQGPVQGLPKQGSCQLSATSPGAGTKPKCLVSDIVSTPRGPLLPGPASCQRQFQVRFMPLGKGKAACFFLLLDTSFKYAQPSC